MKCLTGILSRQIPKAGCYCASKSRKPSWHAASFRVLPFPSCEDQRNRDSALDVRGPDGLLKTVDEQLLHDAAFRESSGSEKLAVFPKVSVVLTQDHDDLVHRQNLSHAVRKGPALAQLHLKSAEIFRETLLQHCLELHGSLNVGTVE